MILNNDNKSGLGTGLKLDEKTHVEIPFLEQLRGLGWEILTLEMQQQPPESYRSDFSEVVLKPK